MTATGNDRLGQEKLDDINDIFSKLREDLNTRQLPAEQRAGLLGKLKVYGRNPQDAEPIFTREGVQTLTEQALDYQDSDSASREALSCIANSLLLRESTRQTLADLGVLGKVVEKYKNENSHDEFLAGRILFLITYARSVDFKSIVNENYLAQVICKQLQRHANGKLPVSTPMDENGLSETCKLIFNITHFYPELASSFSKSITPLFILLGHYQKSTPPLRQPIATLINALLNLDFGQSDSSSSTSNQTAFPDPDQNQYISVLISYLDEATKHYKDSDLEQLGSPLVSLLQRLYIVAPRAVRQSMEKDLLPSDQERNQPLGSGGSLAARLLNLSTSPSSANLRTTISALQFEMSGKDASKFVQNIGFGFASGFLMNQGIPVPNNAQSGSDSSGAPINPITGQRLDTEPADTGPPMTDEEKEREAEKLFVLFERLKKTGVMNVKNPVQEAVEKGRFEELPD